MVSGISQANQQAYLGTVPAYAVQQPQRGIVATAPADTAAPAKKGSAAKKTVFAVLGTAAVAAAALFGLVKTGKLKAPEDATTFLGKLQNYAFNAGDTMVKGYDSAKKSLAEKDIFKTVQEKVSSGIDTIKGLFGKKGAEEATEKVTETVAEALPTVVDTTV